MSMSPLCLAANIGSVGAHEHREAAMAVYQTGRNRCLAMLVSSYRKSFQVRDCILFDRSHPGRPPCRLFAPRQRGVKDISKTSITVSELRLRTCKAGKNLQLCQDMPT